MTPLYLILVKVRVKGNIWLGLGLEKVMGKKDPILSSDQTMASWLNPHTDEFISVD